MAHTVTWAHITMSSFSGWSVEYTDMDFRSFSYYTETQIHNAFETTFLFYLIYFATKYLQTL